MNEENKNEMCLEEARAMIYIPKDSVEIELNATIYVDGEIIKVGRKLDMEECQKAIRDAALNYMEDDDVFVLTDKGRALFESLKGK